MSFKQDIVETSYESTEVFVVILGVPEKFRGDRLVQEMLDSGIKFVRVDGINAESFSFPPDWENHKRSHFMIGRNLTNGEMACTWGHMRALQTGITAGADWLLILEDNVNPNNVYQIIKSLKVLEFAGPTLISFYCEPKFNILTKRLTIDSAII